MISQKCPKCLSSRVRRGYRPTPLWSKIIFRYNLLCDNCNWEFRGFAVPGTVSAKPTKNPKKKSPNKTNGSPVDADSPKSFADLPIERLNLQVEPVRLHIESVDSRIEPVNLQQETAAAVASLDRMPGKRGTDRKDRSAKKQKSGV